MTRNMSSHKKVNETVTSMRSSRPITYTWNTCEAKRSQRVQTLGKMLKDDIPITFDTIYSNSNNKSVFRGDRRFKQPQRTSDFGGFKQIQSAVISPQNTISVQELLQTKKFGNESVKGRNILESKLPYQKVFQSAQQIHSREAQL